MRFERDGLVFNLLDTPGHEDFSEDTYRTLTAVDSAIMVIDAAKGIETQTRKLFEVCRLRDIPIITFINKIDREGRHPFELLDQIQSELALDTAPVTWPMGMGTDFSGVVDLEADVFLTSSHGRGGAFDLEVKVTGLDDPKLLKHVSAPVLSEYHDQIVLASEGYPQFLRRLLPRGAPDAGHLRQRAPRLFGRRAFAADRQSRAAAAAAAEHVRPGRSVRKFGVGLRVQSAGEHGPEPPRPDRVHAALLRKAPPRHEADAGAHRQGADRPQPGPLLRPGPPHRRRRGRRRRRRHSEPRRASRRRYARRRFRHAFHRPPLVRPGSAPPRAARRFRAR